MAFFLYFAGGERYQKPHYRQRRRKAPVKSEAESSTSGDAWANSEKSKIFDPMFEQSAWGPHTSILIRSILVTDVLIASEKSTSIILDNYGTQ